MNQYETVGFTGTQEGMTDAQKESVRRIFELLKPRAARHGMCVGADEDFHHIVRNSELNARGLVKIHGHPGVNKAGVTAKRAEVFVDVIAVEKFYLERNKDIVCYSDIMIVCPKGFEEERRSGTWTTARYARKMCRELVIVWPDGTVKREKP